MPDGEPKRTNSPTPFELLNKAKDKFKSRARKARSQFTNSKWFQEACRDAYRKCDLNGDGSLSAAEVYVGILLLYLQISRYVPGAAPPDKKRILRLVDQMDVNDDGGLDVDEFTALATVLCESIAGKVTVEAVSMYVIGPVLTMVVTWLLQVIFDMDAICGIMGESYRWIIDSIIDLVLLCAVFAVVVPKVSAAIDRYTSKQAEKRAHILEAEATPLAQFGDKAKSLAFVTDLGRTRLRYRLPNPADSGMDLYRGEVQKEQLLGVVDGPKKVVGKGTFYLVRTREGAEGWIRADYVEVIEKSEREN
eukprot:Hpha_TRINITY_DN16141_c5_g1::TRINITY_DN16141_c5_g1_i1::g.6062::m.6062